MPGAQRWCEAGEAERRACVVELRMGLQLPQLQQQRRLRPQRHCCGAYASAVVVVLGGTCGTPDVEGPEMAFLRGPAVLPRVCRAE